MTEKTHKSMGFTGTVNLIAGIISIVTGIAIGVMLIISGSKILSERKNILF